ncbi:hypothetical protein FYJ24_07370 [Actinomycetaceae bacterium WB03_NA08]|uniref:Uncharacterized protein n=1 Tax=Scrofimicrobium canadense TaxID=2652290 RepID=A0A6N7VS30_9ACTO|nr:hypothetical protein [Scrofimicrobium canadense]MSS84584.1 hypothetical protein [Scrofimicrobium canadense]
MVDRLVADIDALDDLGNSLFQVRDLLDGLGERIAAEEDSLGSPAVIAAVGGFESHWSRGRRLLRGSADALGQMLIDSAATYESGDADIAASLQVEQGSTSAVVPQY